MIPLLAAPIRRWECPNCTSTDVTNERTPHTRFHVCVGLRGLTAPMVPAGQRCKVEAVPREDYIGNDDVQFDDDRRPIMAAVVTRDEGTDVTVYAPCATALIR